MSKVLDVVAEVGMTALQTKKGQTIGKGTVCGLTAIGAGTAIETVAGSLGVASVSSVGAALTGAGCAAAQTAITAASTIPVVGGTLATGIASASTAVFVIASNPITWVVGAVAAGGFFINKILSE